MAELNKNLKYYGTKKYYRCAKCGDKIPIIPGFTKYYEVFRYKTREGKIKRVPICLVCQMLKSEEAK